MYVIRTAAALSGYVLITLWFTVPYHLTFKIFLHLQCVSVFLFFFFVDLLLAGLLLTKEANNEKLDLPVSVKPGYNQRLRCLMQQSDSLEYSNVNFKHQIQAYKVTTNSSGEEVTKVSLALSYLRCSNVVSSPFITKKVVTCNSFNLFQDGYGCLDLTK